MSTTGSVCNECKKDFYPDGVDHEHCNLCHGTIPMDNCEGPVSADCMGSFGSTKGFECTSCGEWSHNAPCGDRERQLCAPCLAQPVSA